MALRRGILANKFLYIFYLRFLPHPSWGKGVKKTMILCTSPIYVVNCNLLCINFEYLMFFIFLFIFTKVSFERILLLSQRESVSFSIKFPSNSRKKVALRIPKVLNEWAKMHSKYVITPFKLISGVRPNRHLFFLFYW